MLFLVNRMKQGIVRYTGYGVGDCGADRTGQPGTRGRIGNSVRRPLETKRLRNGG